MILFSYFVGAGGTLAYKLGRYLYHAPKYQQSKLEALWDWFFNPSAENATSWLTTVGVVWMLGVWYSGNLQWGNASQDVIPIHPAVAFVLGTLAELIAPAVAKKIVSLVANQFGGK